jgi:cytochrome P450
MNIDIDIASTKFKANPYPFYARWRAVDPVCRVVLPDREPAWLITRYDDVAAVLKDDRFVKDRMRVLTPEQLAAQPWMPRMFRPLSRNMLDLDPPDHTRLRALVQKAFLPRSVEQMRPRIESLADELLDSAMRRRRVDLIRDYALPIPATIIAEMLGVPAKDRHRFHRWSNGILLGTASRRFQALKLIPHVLAFLRYIRKLIASRRAEPRDDMLTALAQVEDGGQRLSEDELVSMVFLLLLAGHETTVNLIGNGVLALLTHRDQLERLRREPALIGPAVEELLRFDSPVDMSTERRAREDLKWGDVTIRRGEQVFAVLASANRDERQFAEPDRLDITRDPNKHLSFGLGAHYCLGAPLARLEGQIAIQKLLLRGDGLRLAVPADALRWRPGLVVRGLMELPIAFAHDESPGSRLGFRMLGRRRSKATAGSV